MKNMKGTKKKHHQDVYLRFGRLAAGLLHVLHALHGENWCSEPACPAGTDSGNVSI